MIILVYYKMCKPLTQCVMRRNTKILKMFSIMVTPTLINTYYNFSIVERNDYYFILWPSELGSDYFRKCNNCNKLVIIC